MATTTGNIVWSYWTTSSAPTTETGETTWLNWNSTSTSTSSSTTGDYIWVTWVSDSTGSATGANEAVERHVYKTAIESQEERKRRLAREREKREHQIREQKRKREAAEEKAKHLLLDLIGPEDLKVYEETGRLFVKGHKHDYIVQRSGMVKQVKKDKIIDLCVHLSNRSKYPETDNVVALKLAIEADEQSVVKMANKHGSRQREGDLPKAACM